MTTSRAALGACMLLASTAATAQFFTPPFDPGQVTFGATLRCWFKTPQPGSPLHTDHLNVPGQLDGKWANHASAGKATMFYTDEAPSDFRAACTEAASRAGQRGELVDWAIRYGQTKYNNAPWYQGDQSPDEPIERIVAFGDSLSDTGNMYNASEWTFPVHRSWFLGRFSNGPVWTEYLAKMTGKPLHNWAIGGAQSSKSFKLIDGLDDQVASFAAYASFAKDYDPSRTLFTVLMGANDFMSDDSYDIKAVRQVMLRQHKALVKLGKLGARKILILNLPDISVTPSYRASGREEAATAVRDKVRTYNGWLSELANHVREETGADVRIFDMEGKFNELLADPSAFGIENTTESCLNLPKDNKIDYLRGVQQRAECAPDKYVFWDLVHPTTRVHKLIADWAFTTASEAWGLKKH